MLKNMHVTLVGSSLWASGIATDPNKILVGGVVANERPFGPIGPLNTFLWQILHR